MSLVNMCLCNTGDFDQFYWLLTLCLYFHLHWLKLEKVINYIRYVYSSSSHPMCANVQQGGVARCREIDVCVRMFVLFC